MEALRDRRVVVVGAGLAGLVTAHALRRAGLAVTVLESTPHVGGKMRTLHERGYTIEWGPQSFLHEESSALSRVIDWVGLADRLQEPYPDAKKRFVLRRGRLWQVPKQLPRLLSVGGLVRASTEVFRKRGPQVESVDAFARRRFGNEVAEILIGSLVSGVFAGDPARLELQSAFPRMAQLELDHGSLVRAMFGGGFKPRGLRSFKGGMGVLPTALAEAFGDDLRLGTAAQRVERAGEGWVVEARDAQAPAVDAHAAVEAEVDAHAADAVVLTTPAFAAASLLRLLDRSLADALDAIAYASLAVVSLGYDLSAFPTGAPSGFGFLVPRSEALRTLGCLYPSAVFPDAAPENKVLLRVMIGGRLDPDAASLPEGELLAIARAEVEPLLGVAGEPELTRVLRHAQAIPQYELGHLSRLRLIEAAIQRQPGLFLTGNPYRGVSVGDVAADAERAAQRVVEYLEASA